ncbi:putative lipase 2 protein [Fonsecaea pedrosoi]|nr:putative lipase 2 protein [Fonsecaea pedrosoi]
MKHKYTDDKNPAEAMFTQPFGISWRKALVSLPRLVPDFVLNFTASEGPQPIVFEIPSRGKHLIPVYVWVPPLRKHRHHHIFHSQKNAAGAHLKDALRPIGIDDDHDAKLPVLIDFHGGSFILGSCQEQAPFCARMCRELNCVVISVDYRLGPYAQFPAANLDAEDVVLAVIDPSSRAFKPLREGILWEMLKQGRKPIELDEQKIAFSGFSSGGNIALNLALSIKDDPTAETDWVSPLPWDWPNDIPVLLFYPSLDARLLPHERPRPEGLNPPSGFVERWKIEKELMPTYLPPEKRGHPRASPGLADIRARDGENFGLHPKARMLLVLPQFDSLNEQSMTWIQKVRDEGRGDDLIVEEVKGVVHGWTQFPDSWISDLERKLKLDAFRRAREFLEDHWHLDTRLAVETEVISHDKDGVRQSSTSIDTAAAGSQNLGEA